MDLMTEVVIGPVTLANRMAFCAPSPAYGGVDEEANRPTEALAAYWAGIARGGAGLIIGEPQSVHPTSTTHPRTIENLTDEVVPRYRRVTDAVHEQGGRLFGHLWHAGLLGAPGYRSLPLWAPSAVRAPAGAYVPAGGGGIAHALTAEEIAEVVAAFGAAAGRLREAGFDGIEVNAASGFLLAEFLSPAVNRRTDGYGGSLENRCRLVAEVLGAVREAAGDGLAVGVRLGPDPYVEPGLTEADLPAIAAELARRTRLDYVHVVPALTPDAASPDGDGAETARAVREATGLPTIYSGIVTHHDDAEGLVRGGGIDLVGATRALLADPDLPTKVREGRTDEIRPCIACNQTCTGGVPGLRAATTPYCLFTPSVADGVGAPADAGAGRRLLVIGAGLAGLETARLARLLGFDVTVWERGPDIGGQLSLVARIPQRARFAEAVDFYRRQIPRWGIDLRVNTEATPAAVDEMNPDVVVVATGSVPAMPEWARSGDSTERDCLVTEVRAVLSGVVQPGQRVVVAMSETEHGYQALPAAEFLADRGHQVTIVSPAFEPSVNQEFYVAEQAYRRLLRKGVRIITSHEVVGARPGEVAIRDVHAHRPGTLPADTVVVAYGGAADDALYHALRARWANVFSAGDCVAPRDMEGAVSDALRVMANLTQAVRG